MSHSFCVVKAKTWATASVYWKQKQQQKKSDFCPHSSRPFSETAMLIIGKSFLLDSFGTPGGPKVAIWRKRVGSASRLEGRVEGNMRQNGNDITQLIQYSLLPHTDICDLGAHGVASQGLWVYTCMCYRIHVVWLKAGTGAVFRMRCLRGGVEVLYMHTHVITFAQNDEPVQFYHHRIDLGYLIIEILACLPAGFMSICYILEHKSSYV